MSMYDHINGYQIKCFPWVYYKNYSLSEDGLNFVMGTFTNYETGKKIPYRSLPYNYGKDFMILDENPEVYDYDELDESIHYVVHVIRNGFVMGSYLDTDIPYDFKDNNCVLGYYGEKLNINSQQEVLEYIAAKKQYKKDLDRVTERSRECFKEISKYFRGIGLLDKESDEYKERTQKLEELYSKMDIIKEEESVDRDPIVDAYNKRWYVDTSNSDIFSKFGSYLGCLYNLNEDDTEEDVNQLRDIIISFYNSNHNILNEFYDWSDISTNNKMKLSKFLNKYNLFQ